MKKKLPYHLLFLLAGFLLTFVSCEKEVEIEIPGYQEQLVVDGSIELDQPPFILLSKSKDIYAPTDIQSFLGSFVSGAQVTVSDGSVKYPMIEVCTDNLPPGMEELAAEAFGLPVSELSKYHLCAYTSFDPNIFGKQGITYELEVQYEGKTYTSSSQMLTAPVFDSVYWKAAQGLPDYGYSYVTFTDPGNTKDAYQWEVRRINTNSEGKPIDAGFTRTFNPVFDDEFINGLTFDFWYENPMSFDDESLPEEYRGYYAKGDTVVIKFSKMDQIAFEFFEKKYVQLSSGGSPFASPANIPGNIEGGALGIWVALAPLYDTLVCLP
ncbi:MAG: DUF4249 domain-containing protein [Bacteroidetes bacterium]|nr:MAG: DUF4249 domain-containing protein [Bacteroidota bacterium]